MKLKKLLLLAALAGTTIAAPLQAAVVRVAADVTADTTWTANNTYILDTVIYVRNNATLTIEPGTVVKGATTVTIGRLNCFANSKSRTSCPGTAMMAPVP